jgi:aminopeptidase N
MENWGLITFREHDLLFDTDNTSLPTKQRIVMVIAHELTHQWFGNLVTMRWWTDLWLNEGFAERMAYKPMDHFYPDWQVWTLFAVDEQYPGLKLDALANTHPVQVPINDPEEIRTIFDTISYQKGASSVHMLEHYLGPETFQSGIHHYLKRHAYGNTDTVDLWQALEEMSGKPVKAFMGAWIELSGHPVVHTHVGEGQVHLKQEQFIFNPFERAKKGALEPYWPIPLEAGDDVPELFDTPEAEFPAPENRILKLNHDHTGFYRTIYNATHLERLAEEVRKGHLDAIDRLGLLSDTFDAAKAGYSDTTIALHLLEAYREEDNNAVWDVIAGNIGSVRAVMDDEKLRGDMKPYIRQLVAKQLKRLGWEEIEGESPFDKLLRPTILGLAAVAEETSVVDEALRRFNAMKKLSDLPPDLRGVICSTAAYHGTAATFDRLFRMHHESTSSEEKVTLVGALTNFKQPALITKALAAITTDEVRLQDVIYWIAYSFSNRHARLAAWDWLTANWPWLKENLGGDFAFSRMPVISARPFSDPAFLPKYKKFFESVMSPILDRSYKQGVELLEWQSEWKKRDLALTKAYFAQR